MLNLYKRFNAAESPFNCHLPLYTMLPAAILTGYQLISVNITQSPVQNDFEIVLHVLNWAKCGSTVALK